jgi:hypothetical protein
MPVILTIEQCGTGHLPAALLPAWYEWWYSHWRIFYKTLSNAMPCYDAGQFLHIIEGSNNVAVSSAVTERVVEHIEACFKHGCSEFYMDIFPFVMLERW